MLPCKTVFVVGAGASAEVNLPVGDALKGDISRILDFRFNRGQRDPNFGSSAVYEAFIREFPHDFSERALACAKIVDGVGLSASIDDFIETYKADSMISQCGKVAIAHAILSAERTSPLFPGLNQRFDVNSISGTWYPSFYRWLQQGVERENLHSLFQNLTIVSFNYDRCIQQFLTKAVVTHFALTERDALAILQKLKIYFPYGSVGPYHPENGKFVPFGSDRLPSCATIIADLKTYSEQVEDHAAMGDIRAAIAEAEVLVFLGNAYHENNMALLAAGAAPVNKPKKIFATRRGIKSEEDLGVVRRRLERLTGRKITNFHFADTCVELFKQYPMVMREP